jgi:hypothetical protein
MRLGIAWRGLGHWMGRINAVVLLSLFYWLLLTPLAVCLRLAGRDPLFRMKGAARDSFWEEGEDGGVEELRRQY